MKFGAASVVASILITFHASSAAAISIPTVSVGNPRNPNSFSLRGRVDYEYRIGKYEVTNAQYAEFLNAKAATSDPLGLYNNDMSQDFRGGIARTTSSGQFVYTPKANMGDKPVNYVSFYDAIRFANWLHNGAGTGSTETGAYNLTGLVLPGDASDIVRSSQAKWFVPSVNEWHKAAYYEPGSGAISPIDDYWRYATRSDSTPTGGTLGGPSFDIGNPGPNVANWGQVANMPTTVGSAGSLSKSHYGTYDQTGNIMEWLDTPDFTFPELRWLGGGSWRDTDPTAISGNFYPEAFGTRENADTGFRVGAMIGVPEPSSLALAAVAACCLAVLKRRRR